MRRALGLAVALIGLAIAGTCALAWARAASIPVERLARRAPRETALMRQRAAEAGARGRPFRVDQRWRDYDRISPALRRAILIAEDDAFFTHNGLDWNEIQASARVDLERRRIVRGGSTITQQLAKNLYLGDRRTPLRKLEEAFLAMRLERALTKRRIFELYLNLIEWGDGIYGAEAAARRSFHVAAGDLDARQAVLLAAIIINPRRFSATAPPRRIERRVRLIASRMRRRGYLSAAEYLRAIGAAPPPAPTWLERLFGDGDGGVDSSARPALDDSTAATPDATPGAAADTLSPRATP